MIRALIPTIVNELYEEHQGAVAFEYVIILVIMAVAIFTAWGVLANQVIIKANEIADFIANNGTQAMGHDRGGRGNENTFQGGVTSGGGGN